jgi:L-rhamnose mutarotase
MWYFSNIKLSVINFKVDVTDSENAMIVMSDGPNTHEYMEYIYKIWGFYPRLNSVLKGSRAGEWCVYASLSKEDEMRWEREKEILFLQRNKTKGRQNVQKASSWSLISDLLLSCRVLSYCSLIYTFDRKRHQVTQRQSKETQKEETKTWDKISREGSKACKKNISLFTREELRLFSCSGLSYFVLRKDRLGRQDVQQRTEERKNLVL